METKANIAKAIIAVMKAVKGIEKNLTVGEGKSAYQGVSDKDVKISVGKAMEENGLCILPIGVEAKTQIDRWEETNQWGAKQKQQVFTETKTRYLLLHTSGESIEIEGYGQGVDSQDKSAGKATTYALKYALLYTFLVPTGKIDDADKHASDEYEAPQQLPAKKVLPELTPAHEKWPGAITALIAGKTTILAIKKAYTLTPENETELVNQSMKAA